MLLFLKDKSFLVLIHKRVPWWTPAPPSGQATPGASGHNLSHSRQRSVQLRFQYPTGFWNSGSWDGEKARERLHSLSEKRDRQGCFPLLLSVIGPGRRLGPVHTVSSLWAPGCGVG